MNDTQLIDLVAATDLYAAATPLPESAWSRQAALCEIERRMDMDTRKTQDEDGGVETLPPAGTGARRRWSGAWISAAAFAVIVLLVGGVALLVNSSGDDAPDFAAAAPDTTVNEPTSAAPTTTSTTIIEATVISEAEALAVADSYFAAYEAGDVDAMLDLFAADASYAGYGLDPQRLPRGVDRTVFVLIHVAKAASVEVPTMVECSASATQTSGDEVALRCDYAKTDGLRDAVAAPPETFVMRLTVTSAGITAINDAGGDGDVITAFARWLLDQHPEDAEPLAAGILATFGKWESAEEARRWGEVQAQYADEWAAYLTANGCVWDEPCEP